MTYTGRVKTRKGTIDVYQFPGTTNEVQLGTLRRNGRGYKKVTNYKRILEPGKTIGFSEDPKYDLLVADESFGFIGIDRCGNPVYTGMRSGGRMVLSRSKDNILNVLYADNKTKIHDLEGN